MGHTDTRARATYLGDFVEIEVGSESVCGVLPESDLHRQNADVEENRKQHEQVKPDERMSVGGDVTLCCRLSG